MTIPFHPIANLFPLIEGEEFEALVRDVKASGVREWIVMHDGMILDGRNRYRAALAAGIYSEDFDPYYRSKDGRPGALKSGFQKFVPANGDPLGWVLSLNLHRRHLTESQRAMIANNIATMRQGERTDRKPASEALEPSLVPEPSANLPKVDQDTAAKMLNVSPRLVRDAKTVKDKGSPELVHAVESGKMAASAAAKAAKLSVEDQQKVIDHVEAGHANAARTVLKQAARAQREVQLGAKQQALPEKCYGVILADPEWQFEVRSRDTGLDRCPDNHYPTSSEDEIGARNVASIAANDSVCVLWTTDLARGIRTLERWGFTYKSYMVWVKDIVEQGHIEEDGRSRRIFVEVGPPGLGFLNRDRDEIVLIGTRGNVPCPAMGTQGESVVFAERPHLPESERGQHSAKPPFVHEWAEKHYPNLPKIELNARTARPGWDCWGNEAPVTANENDEPGDMLGDAGEPVAINFELPPETEEPEDDGDNEFADELLSVSAMLASPAKPSDFDPDRDMPAFLRRTPEKQE